MKYNYSIKIALTSGESTLVWERSEGTSALGIKRQRGDRGVSSVRSTVAIETLQ